MEMTATQGANGALPMTARETIAQQLEAEIDRNRQRKEALEAELGGINGEIKAFEQALSRLRGEPLTKSPKRAPGRPTRSAQPRVPARIGDERVEMVRAAILDFAVDHEEFRQVDIRAASGLDKSGAMALAFEQLRQAGIIRFARKDGIQKFFRLTSEGLRLLQERRGEAD